MQNGINFQSWKTGKIGYRKDKITNKERRGS